MQEWLPTKLQTYIMLRRDSEAFSGLSNALWEIEKIETSNLMGNRDFNNARNVKDRRLSIQLPYNSNIPECLQDSVLHMCAPTKPSTENYLNFPQRILICVHSDTGWNSQQLERSWWNWTIHDARTRKIGNLPDICFRLKIVWNLKFSSSNLLEVSKSR